MGRDQPDEGTRILVEGVSGDGLQAVIPDLARLRLRVFAEYPYLYEGSMAEEERYMQAYQASALGLIAVARLQDSGAVAGVSTALPMEDAESCFSTPFRDKGFDSREILYCGESVLLPEWRGFGLGHRFFDLREAHGRALGRKYSCFCAVIRPEDHPLRPADYHPHDVFWRKRGYTPVEGLVCHFTWKDRGEAQATEKAMQFWLREL